MKLVPYPPVVKKTGGGHWVQGFSFWKHPSSRKDSDGPKKLPCEEQGSQPATCKELSRHLGEEKSTTTTSPVTTSPGVPPGYPRTIHTHFAVSFVVWRPKTACTAWPVLCARSVFDVSRAPFNRENRKES